MREREVEFVRVVGWLFCECKNEFRVYVHKLSNRERERESWYRGGAHLYTHNTSEKKKKKKKKKK
jgi:hypothetical protein